MKLVAAGVLGILLVLNRSQAAEPVDPQTIQTWLDHGIKSTGEIEDPDATSFASYHLARVRSRAGDAHGAFASTKQITNMQHKLYALKHVAEAARAAGDTELCREIVATGRSPETDKDSSFLLGAFLDVCFAADQPEAALLFADETYRPEMGPQAYLRIVSEFCKAGDRASAEQLVQDKQLGDAGRYYMIGGLIEADDIEAAIEIARGIQDSLYADQANAALALALARKDELETSEAWAARIQDKNRRRFLIEEMSRVGAQGDSLEQLRVRFAAYKSREEKAALLPTLVQRLVAEFAFDEADRAIEAAVATIESSPQPDAKSKFGTYGDVSAVANVRSLHFLIADAMVDKGQLKQAARQLEKGSTALDAVPPEAAVVKWMSGMLRIRTLLKLDRVDEALEKVDQLGASGMRAKIAAPIAVYLIKAGKIEKGLKIISEDAGPSPDESEKGEIAAALLEAAGFEKTLEYLAAIDDSRGGAAAFQQLARMLTEQGKLDELEKLYAALDSPVAKAHLAIGTAERLQFDKA